MSDTVNGRQGSAANIVTRRASEYLEQDSAQAGGMLGRYVAAAAAVLVLAVSIRPILAAFMAVASIGFR